jgi:hypothetical protein
MENPLGIDGEMAGEEVPTGSINPLRDLGEDVLGLRMRGQAGGSVGAGRPVGASVEIDKSADVDWFEVAKNFRPIDLNNEEGLRSLEDRGLIEHMGNAREKYKNMMRAESRDTGGDAEWAAAGRELSGVLSDLNDLQMTVQCLVEQTLLNADNIDRLMRGEQPHGYTPVASASEIPAALAENLKTLCGASRSTGRDLEAISTTLREFGRGLTLARRSFEALKPKASTQI